MALDPSIILGVKTPLQNQIEANQAQAGQLQNQVTRNQIQQLPVANQIQQNQAQVGQNTVSQLPVANQTEQLRNQAAQLEQQQSKLSLVGQLIGSAVDQPSYDAAKQKAAQMGLDISTAPPTFDPNYVKSIHNQALTASQQIQLQTLQTEQAYKQAMIGLGAGRLAEKTANDSGTLAQGNTVPSFVPPAAVAINPQAGKSLNLPAGVLPPPSVAGAPSPLDKIQPAAGNAPNPTAVPQDLSKLKGMDYVNAVQQQDPARANRMLGIANGEQPLPNSRGIKHDPILDDVNMAFPGTPATRYKTFQDFFGGGKPQQAVNNLGTAIGHAGELFDAIQKLHQGDVLDSPITNGFANAVNTKLGSSNVTNFNAIVQPLSHEIEKLYSGTSGGAQKELENQMTIIGDPNATKNQQVGALNTVVQLMASKTQSYKDQYDESMKGAPSPRPFQPLTLGRQAIIDKISQGAGSTGNIAAAPIHPALQTPQAAQIKAQLQAGQITQDQAIKALQQATGAQ